MASLGDLTLFISAETSRARSDIEKLGKEADRVANENREIGFSLDKARNAIKNFKRDIDMVGGALKKTYQIAKNTPQFDDEVETAENIAKGVAKIGSELNKARKPGVILQRTFDGMGGSVASLVSRLAQLGFALYGLQQITGVLNQAFGGFFNATIGRAIKLEETILKTQVALASTNDVLRGGQVITDPYESIVALTGVIEQRIASIRDRSLELAGVTSDEVIEVFGMVSQQVGQIGGSLKDAEDLAISFAGALGTFGIPLYQARQEIGSILRGDITTDSYLAKALGISNDDVQKAKNTTEGVVGFLQKKLSTAVAGQKIAAQSFSGVLSNIVDFQELIGQAFGSNLVQPLIDGLTGVYNLLVAVKDQALTAATAIGTAVGRAGQLVGGAVTAPVTALAGGTAGARQGADAAQRAAVKLSQSLEKLVLDAQKTFGQISGELTKLLAKVVIGITNLAKGFVGLNIDVFKSLLETFKVLAQAIQPVASAFSALLTVYGQFLELPAVQVLSSIAAQFKVLETIGVNSLVQLIAVGRALLSSLGAIKAAITTVAGVIARGLAMALSAVGLALAAFGAALTAVVQKLGLANTELATLAGRLSATGASASTAAAGMKGGAAAAGMLGNAVKGLMIKFLAFNVILLAAQVAIAALVEGYARWERANKQAKAIDRFRNSMEKLNTTFKNVNENSTAAQQALKRVAETEAKKELEELEKAYAEAAAEADRLAKGAQRLRAIANNPGVYVRGETPEADAKAMEAAAKKALQRRNKLEADLNEASEKQKRYLALATIDEEVSTRSKKLGETNEKLAKQQRDLNRQIVSDRFRAEQDLASRRLELERSIAQEAIELALNRNRRLIEGEEGASAAALQGLIEYAKTRQENEADYERQRKQMALDLADLEKELEDYKFSIGEKILELKKQGAKLDKETAEYVQKVYMKIAKDQAANAAALLSGNVNLTAGSGARVGNTGRSTGPHLDLRSGNKEQVLKDAQAIIQVWQQLGLEYIELSNINKSVKDVKDPAQLRKLLEQEMATHGRRVAAGTFAIDIAVPEGTVVPGAQAVSATQDPGGGGFTSRLASGTSLLHLMNPKAGMADTTQLQKLITNASNFEPADVKPFEDAKRATLKTLEQVQDSQQRLKAIAADRQLQDALKQLVPEAAVEKYEDLIIRVQEYGKAVQEGYNPEQAEIVADLAAREAIARRELGQFLEKNAEIFKDDADTRQKVDAEAKKMFEERIKLFDQENEKRREALKLEQELSVIKALQTDIRNSGINTQKGIISGAAGLASGTEFSTFAQRRIQAEAAIETRRIDLVAQNGGNPLRGEALRKFEQFREESLVSAEKMAQLDGLTQRFQQLGEIASGVGNSIGTAFTQGFADILTGAASVQDVLGNMFKGIADSFMQMAQKIIADMIKMLVYKALLGLFGGQNAQLGSLGGLPANTPFGAGGGQLVGRGTLGPNFGIPQFAKGGIVTSPTPALIGEGGMNEAVVPLPNGKAIPVDFGKKGGPAGDTTTNITVNIDQSGAAQTQMSGEDASKLGKAIDGAVKRVIMEERRAGGLLYNGRR